MKDAATTGGEQVADVAKDAAQHTKEASTDAAQQVRSGARLVLTCDRKDPSPS